VTPLVTAPGDTNPSDATDFHEGPTTFFQKYEPNCGKLLYIWECCIILDPDPEADDSQI